MKPSQGPRIDEREHAAEARLAVLGFDVGERGEERGVVLGVRRAIVRETRRAHAGAATERIDLEPRIVGERERHRGVRDRLCLRERVLLEALRAFDDRDALGQNVGHGDDVDRQIGEESAKLEHLGAVRGRDDERDVRGSLVRTDHPGHRPGKNKAPRSTLAAASTSR